MNHIQNYLRKYLFIKSKESQTYLKGIIMKLHRKFKINSSHQNEKSLENEVCF